MKAAVYYETGPPDVFRYEEVPDPVCQAGGVVIDVEVVSIEGGDTLHRRGGEIAQRPHIVGYQCAGSIREVGAEVRDLEVGQRVVAVMPQGSHAERAAVPGGSVWPIPEGLGTDAAACVPIPFGTADDCLFEFGRLREGETVLVQAGASGVGLAAIQLAKRAGATVLATASTDAKLERLREFGVDHGINYAGGDFVDAVREHTGGRGVDLVVDCVGGHVLEGSLASLAYRGRAVSVGRAGREDYRPDLSQLGAGNRSLTGVFLGAEMAVSAARVHGMIARHLEAIEKGELVVVIDQRFSLADAAAAHSYIEERRAFGRVLLLP